MDSRLINFDTKDIHGRTPLMKTCIYGHNYVIKLLIIQEAKTLISMVKIIVDKLK